MKSLLVRSLIALVPGLIVSGGMVAWSFALTGGWPPDYLLVAASIGGMASPLCYELARRIRERPPKLQDPSPATPGDRPDPE